MKKLKKEIKYWSQLFLMPLYGLSYLMPRDKNIWVFGSTFGGRFADNPKYFYLYINQYKSNQVRAVWISKNKSITHFLNKNKMEGYYLYSLKGIWYSLRAKVYLYDNYSKDICFSLSGGATKINLWHGIPLKKIQKDNLFDRIRNPRNLKEKLYGIPRRISDEKPTDYILSTSRFMKNIYSSAFGSDRVIINGYPRNDILICNTFNNIVLENEKGVIEKLISLKEDNRMVLYMPTFRDSEIKLFDVLNFDKFQEFLNKNNLLFCIKVHPKSKIHRLLSEKNYRNMIIIHPQADSYPLLKLADVLVTDYSSIYFDYLLMNKPIIFFSYDLYEYLENSRSMYFDYFEFTPGKKAQTMEELESELISPDAYQEERVKIRNMVFDEAGECASEKLFNRITKELQIDNV